ncbi:hypothetical protein [Acidicapsa ligni]|uniref:hypothetical protein n=1 Tax=Acidicapsa ligni TaxID=542300 RepID=UPI0021E0315E|nr:hypothetical protein [Acidicapsa ligni]
MALKAGTDNKRNVIIAGVLFCLVAYLGISQLFFSGPSAPPAPAPVVPRTRPRTVTATSSQNKGAESASNSANSVSSAGEAGPAAEKLPSSGLDPALHVEKLALSESIEYAGSGRNIFSEDSAPIAIERPAASARQAVAAVSGPAAYVPPPVPQPPAIDLRYFGYTSTKSGSLKAYLLHGEDIFEASPGEIVDHRFKIVTVQPGQVQVTDLSYNNTQSLPISTN